MERNHLHRRKRYWCSKCNKFHGGAALKKWAAHRVYEGTQPNPGLRIKFYHLSNRCRKSKHEDCNGHLLGSTPPRRCTCECHKKSSQGVL